MPCHVTPPRPKRDTGGLRPGAGWWEATSIRKTTGGRTATGCPPAPSLPPSRQRPAATLSTEDGGQAPPTRTRARLIQCDEDCGEDGRPAPARNADELAAAESKDVEHA